LGIYWTVGGADCEHFVAFVIEVFCHVRNEVSIFIVFIVVELGFKKDVPFTFFKRTWHMNYRYNIWSDLRNCLVCNFQRLHFHNTSCCESCSHWHHWYQEDCH
jgi:hypothetical protein